MPTSSSRNPRPLPQPVRLLLDLFFVLVFIAIGLMSHAEPLAGIFSTALPFLLANLAAHVAIWVVASRRRLPLLLEGVMAWLITLTAGMALRVSLGETAATAFVIVAAITLAVFLVGWRLAWSLMHKQ